MVIYTSINGFSTNKVMSDFSIFEHSIINYQKRGFYLVFSNNSNVDSLDIFRKVVSEKVHNDIVNLRKKELSRRYFLE